MKQSSGNDQTIVRIVRVVNKTKHKRVNAQGLQMFMLKSVFSTRHHREQRLDRDLDRANEIANADQACFVVLDY